MDEVLTLSPVFSGVPVTRSLVLYIYCVARCLYFFFWPLCCLFFCNIRILIAPLVSPNFSYEHNCTDSILAIVDLQEYYNLAMIVMLSTGFNHINILTQHHWRHHYLLHISGCYIILQYYIQDKVRASR